MATVNLNPISTEFYYISSGTKTTWTNAYIGCASNTVSYNARLVFDLSTYNLRYVTNMTLTLTGSSITGTTFYFSIKVPKGNYTLSAVASSSTTTTSRVIPDANTQRCKIMYEDGIDVLGGYQSTYKYLSGCSFSLSFNYDDPGYYTHVIVPYSSIVQYANDVETSYTTRDLSYTRGSSGAATTQQLMSYFPMAGYDRTKISEAKFVVIPETFGVGGSATYTEYVYLKYVDTNSVTSVSYDTKYGYIYLFGVPGLSDVEEVTGGFYLYLYSSNYSRNISLTNVETYIEFDYLGPLPGSKTIMVYTADGWKSGEPYVYDGSVWRKGVPSVYDGSQWN